MDTNETTTAPKTSTPRGPTKRVAPRLEACREALLALAAVEGGVNALGLLAVAEDRFVYTDILLVAKQELAKGTIQESRKGRKATWVTAQAE